MTKTELIVIFAEWANQWVGDFINEKIISYTNDALDNPCFVQILVSWKEASDDYKAKRMNLISKAMRGIEKFKEDDVLLNLYKERTSRNSETLYNFFKEEVFKKEGGKNESNP